MEKREYLLNRLKKDFLKYCLLQEDSLSAKNIAEKLYGVIDLDWLISQSRQEIETLCNKYLSFEKIKVDGKLSNELSEELGYELKDKILTEYEDFLESYSIDKITSEVISNVERSIERQTWANGIINMQEAINLLVDRLKNASISYGNLYTAPISEGDVLDKFNKAKESTLLERIQGNNVDDIIEYRGVLMEYVQVSCENMLYAKLKDIYRSIANDGTYEQLQYNFRNHIEYALALKSSIVDCEANEDWDKEYNRLVPTDFYYRNVENITAKHAFQMILLQLFAKNEDWMIENGLLVNGELNVFISKSHLEKIQNVLSLIIVNDTNSIQ